MRAGTVLRPIKVNFWLTKGGMGDTLARLPAIKYALDHTAHLEQAIVWVQDYMVEFCQFLFASYDTRAVFKGYSQKAELDNTIPGMMTDSDHHTTLKTHITDHAFHTLLDFQPTNIDARNYLKFDVAEYERKVGVDVCDRYNLNNYVVICTGFTSATREWLPQYINQVSAWLKEQGIQPVFLGKSQSFFDTGAAVDAKFREEIDFAGGVNLLDKTDVFEAATIMSKARAVVGVDNGLLHLAATTDVWIIGGFTSVHPVYRLPYREHKLGYKFVAIGADKLECGYCQTQLHLLFNFNFRGCLYGDYKCTEEMSGERFIKQLKAVLRGQMREE